jgi:hypothetical protein
MSSPHTTAIGASTTAVGQALNLLGKELVPQKNRVTKKQGQNDYCE